MTYRGTLIVVKDCNEALKFYSDLFGLSLVQNNDGNMELTENIYLQEVGYKVTLNTTCIGTVFKKQRDKYYKKLREKGATII